MSSALDCKMYTQKETCVGRRHAWLYLIATPIGNIYVVEWEKPGLELDRIFYDEQLDKAERKYKAICKQLVEQYCQ